MPTRQRNAGAGYKERSRRERAKARGVTPLTFRRMLQKTDRDNLNVSREFTRHAMQYLDRLFQIEVHGSAPGENLNLDEHAAFTELFELHTLAALDLSDLEEAA